MSVVFYYLETSLILIATSGVRLNGKDSTTIYPNYSQNNRLDYNYRYFFNSHSNIVLPSSPRPSWKSLFFSFKF